ncbi:uncharacterized protein PHALS_09542 [Plasmopara halstedii]|uniref:Uncharacterized protein n=1 Tax=Plasmopara halstedii TaxID=4781 RepID=A0A0P1A5B9_PLAHL|nr:uncharacterized protein PHALS_09542 [Plasmopara halstedii]CEG35420.1 hypothetical protein PHALS_09542 [Plasmopara halstedii]|eukprot:XP_024571789.1 hypothetical protein PHALS_09542 [Plasmopara halstedii]
MPCGLRARIGQIISSVWLRHVPEAMLYSNYLAMETTAQMNMNLSFYVADESLQFMPRVYLQ